MAIVGPTASGKSAVAMQVAERVGAEILSVDSMQVYQGMDIGTAKADPAERRRVRHHMIDIVEPERPFTVAEFREEARRALETVTSDTALIVGGSGLHFRAVVDAMSFRPSDPRVRREVSAEPTEALVAELLGADPSAGDHVDLSNPRRVRRSVESLRVAGLTPSAAASSPERQAFEAYIPELPFLGFGIERLDVEAAVSDRLDGMRSGGLLDEVERLAPRLGPTASQAVGYRQLLEVVAGRWSEEEGFAAAERATMKLVKQQRTYFRRDPRLTWMSGSTHELADLICRRLEE